MRPLVVGGFLLDVVAIPRAGQVGELGQQLGAGQVIGAAEQFDIALSR